MTRNKKIDVIVQNHEKFITFSFGYFQFKDSFSLLSVSPGKLVKLNKYEGNYKSKGSENSSKYAKPNSYREAGLSI